MPRLPDIPDDFIDASRRLGSDPMLVQGPGGNTSFKQDGVMWIKASGAVLNRAGSDEVFVAVDIPSVLAELDSGDGSCRNALADPSQDLRPSIETTFHALLPHKFVFHYHSVRSIAHSIALEGRRSLHDKLCGLNWAAVPYVRPGLPLSLEIRRLSAEKAADIFILENHGVIVGGEDCADVTDMIAELEHRLDMPARSTKGSPAHGQSVPGWTECRDASPLAMDRTTRMRATAGSYYPDHVVFLGPALKTADTETLRSDADSFGAAVLVPDVGAYLRDGAGAAPETMLVCLCAVLSLIPDDWTLKAIGREAEQELSVWDAEKHRQRLAAKA